MKTLIYGIDGINSETLKIWAPGLLNSIGNLQFHDITDDTLGRGWTKIYCGQPPQVTNGYFQMPVGDGSYKIDKTYNLGSAGAINEGRFKYLWDVADELGLKSVFVNMPTATPVPSSATAFVGGIGGGRYPQDGFDSDLFYPPSIGDRLNTHYTLDQRLNKTFQTFQSFCESLNQVHNTQCSVFRDLCENMDAEVGFYVNKVTVELLFLAYYDMINPNHSHQSVRNGIQKHFDMVSSDMKAVIDHFQPEKVILVSDHGTAPYKFNLNLDVLLERLGFVGFRKDERKKQVRSLVGKFMPNALKAKVKTKLNMNNKRYPLRTPTSDSLCFSTVFDTGNFCGVYLNDERFGGTVKAGDQVTVNRICAALNETPEFLALDLRAEPYEGRSLEAPFANGSPDIFIQKSDEVFCQAPNTQHTALSVNPNYSPISENLATYAYPNSGVKSSKALLASNFAPNEKPKSLLDAYHVIVQAMTESIQ